MVNYYILASGGGGGGGGGGVGMDSSSIEFGSGGSGGGVVFNVSAIMSEKQLTSTMNPMMWGKPSLSSSSPMIWKTFEVERKAAYPHKAGPNYEPVRSRLVYKNF